MKLTIDFETRSCVNLKDCGAWVYSEDPTTDIMCLAVKKDEEDPFIWVNPTLEDRLPDMDALTLPSRPLGVIAQLIQQADIIEAHNAEFERALWQNCFSRKYGVPMLPLDKLRCSLAKASYHSLPRGLGDLCKVLGVPVQKDDLGAAIMRKMCRPKKLVRAEWKELESLTGMDWKQLKELQAALYEALSLGFERASRFWDDMDARFIDPNQLLRWHEDPDDILALCRYCLQDVEAEHAASSALADLPQRELRVWQLDQEVNARGLNTDTVMAQKMVDMVGQYTFDLLDEMATITNGEVKSPKQTAKFKDHVNKSLPADLQLENVQAASVKAALKDPRVQGEARRLLEIRRSLALSSVSKYKAIIDRASADGAVRGSLLYHGAGTGRWSGRGIQPQNFPRGKFKDPELAIQFLLADDTEGVKALWGDPMVVASTCLRGVLIPRPGREFTCADFSNIEGRGVAWLAGEEWKVESFRAYDEGKGEDNYKLAYSRAFGIPVEAVTSDNRQIGKVMELACGYQGSVGAFQSMASVYGVKVPDEQAKELVQLWRRAHPMVVALWYSLEEAALMAVAHPGKAFSYRSVAYRLSKDGRFLLCRLPSGRLLHYPFPGLEEAEMPWGERKTVVTYMGVDSQTGKWVKSKAYGGLLTENVVQALSRDVMAEGMFRVEENGYPVVLTVHDEVLSEHKIGHGSVEEFGRLLSVVPSWADGLPVAAAGWRGNRYRKG